MRKSVLIAALGLMSLTAVAQDAPKEEGFVFTTVKENPITSIKDQQMVDRAVNYVRYHGDAPFGPGGSFYDVMYCLKNYGLVPQEAMPGIMYGDSLPVHTELDAVAGAYVQAIGKGRYSKLTPVWKQGLSAIYDTYLGKCPETFTYQGKEYTPRSFAESLGLNPDDYVSLTSYTHHPFYTQFSIEIQDNWRNALSYNLPLDELMAVMDNAIKTGYTFAWGSDVSEQGFTRDGIAVMPDADRASEMTGSDMARWIGLSAADKRKEMTTKPMQLGDDGRPRHGHLRHRQGPDRQGILHGEELLGRERQVQRHLVCFESLRSLQDDEHPRPQGRPAQGHQEEAGAEIML